MQAFLLYLDTYVPQNLVLQNCMQKIRQCAEKTELGLTVPYLGSFVTRAVREQKNWYQLNIAGSSHGKY